MDGKGAWRDNIFVERLWRSIKYEEVYLRGYDSVSEACASIGQYLTFYNGRRPHSSLDGKTPDQAYFTPLPLVLRGVEKLGFKFTLTMAGYTDPPTKTHRSPSMSGNRTSETLGTHQ